LISSITIQNQMNTEADRQPLITGNIRHQNANRINPMLMMMKPVSPLDEIDSDRTLAGGKDSQRRPAYSSTECAACMNTNAPNAIRIRRVVTPSGSGGNSAG